MSKKKIRKKAIERYQQYLGHDCYGFTIVCSCGEKLTGWSPNECEDKFKKHNH